MNTNPDALRVLIVDDSAVIRGVLGRIIDAEPDMRVVTTAQNGAVALAVLAKIPVDVVLLDIEMPEMDGLAALPRILALRPAPRVIMASSLTQRGAEVTMHAMALGASDFIAKPAARSGSAALAGLAGEITARVRAIGRAARRSAQGGLPSVVPVPAAPRVELLAARTGNATARIVGIASSTGGPNALAEVLSGLPKEFPLPILITQHMPTLFTGLLAQRLERDGGRPCVEARDGEAIRPNCTYVAPGGRHMLVQTNEGQPYVRLTDTPAENFCRPSADPMFRSLAALYGASTLAVVLTGMGEDGMRGCVEVHQRGGRVIAQDEASSVVWGMPGAVVRAGVATSVVALTRIAAAITAQSGSLAA